MIDFTKPVQTRYGLPVRIRCTDRKSLNGMYPVLALVPSTDGNEEIVVSYTENGVSTFGNQYDLVNVPVKHKVWLNIYSAAGGRFLSGNMYSTKDEAYLNKDEAYLNRGDLAKWVACVEVEFTEGQGFYK